MAVVGESLMRRMQQPSPAPSYQFSAAEEEELHEGSQLLAFLQRAVPVVRDADDDLQYVNEPPPVVPMPPPHPPAPPIKHHRRPEPVYPPRDRPSSARTADVRAAPPPRPLSARSARTGRMVVLPNRVDAAIAAAPDVAGAVASLNSGPSTMPPSPRSDRWQPAARPWSDWSVANHAYPVLARPTSAANQPPARQRYAGLVAANNSTRESRWRPSTAPVRFVPPAPPAPPVAAASGVASHASTGGGGRFGGGNGLLLRAGGTGACSGVAFAASSASDDGGGEGDTNAAAATMNMPGGGLGGMWNKKRSTGLSLKSTFNLARRLSAGQQRARQLEKERIQQEHEAHISSLKTALGTPVDPAAPGGMSTASAIEAKMEEELRLAIPPPRDRSPEHLGRTIDKMEVRLGRELSASPRDRNPRGRGFMHQGSRRTMHDESSMSSGMPSKSPRDRERGGLGKGFATARLPPSKETPTSSSHPPPSRPLSASSKESAGREMPPSLAIGKSVSSGGGASQPSKSPAKSPRTYGVGPMGKWADDDGETLEALPMPLPRHRSRPRVLRKDGRAPLSVLASTKEHSMEVQLALELCSPLLKRESLRKMISRILDDPELLPEGADDHGETAEASAAAASSDSDDE